MPMIDRKEKRNVAFLKNYSGPCPTCGYQLNTPASSRCPECGSNLQAVLLAPFRFSPWNAMLTSAAISVGVCLNRLFLSIVGVTQSNHNSASLVMFYMFALSFAVMCGLFLVLWSGKKRMEQLTFGRRCFWYCAAFFLPIVVTIIQYYLFRYFVWN